MGTYNVNVTWQQHRGKQQQAPIELWDGATLADAKVAIMSLDTSFDTERIIVVHKGKTLDGDERVLSELGVGNGSKFFVVIKPDQAQASPQRGEAGSARSEERAAPPAADAGAAASPQRRPRSATRMLADCAPPGTVCVDLSLARKGGAPQSWPENVQISPRSRARLPTVSALANAVASAAGGGLAPGKSLSLARRGQLLDASLGLSEAGLQPGDTVVLYAAVVATRGSPPPTASSGQPSPPAAHPGGQNEGEGGLPLGLMLGLGAVAAAALFAFLRRR
eukprot:TRINITY_DN61322_c0_g1_i1.p1 TRINITY_DN61322_c0_g1~~TRINITY_DN61322_c0_g1_i1.p1  ORF type:complete len:279 (+),score=49.73 TRINITY_DN61322_c0_g1_i1:80-916(+)